MADFKQIQITKSITPKQEPINKWSAFNLKQKIGSQMTGLGQDTGAFMRLGSLTSKSKSNLKPTSKNQTKITDSFQSDNSNMECSTKCSTNESQISKLPFIDRIHAIADIQKNSNLNSNVIKTEKAQKDNNNSQNDQ
jgi:hypothetical protein